MSAILEQIQVLVAQGNVRVSDHGYDELAAGAPLRGSKSGLALPFGASVRSWPLLAQIVSGVSNELPYPFADLRGLLRRDCFAWFLATAAR
jgi:hypothetical protein